MVILQSIRKGKKCPRPPGKDVVIGKKAVYEFWSAGNRKGTTILSHKSVPEKFVLLGAEIHEYGYYYTQSQKEGEAPGPMFSAKYYIIWEKNEKGKWKIKLDIWNNRNPDWNRTI